MEPKMEMPFNQPKENGFENKEEVKNPFSIIYRDNVSFKDMVPVVEAEILANGGKIGMKQAFPAGTPEEEIEKFLRDNKDAVKNSHQIFDTTSKIAFTKSTGTFEEGRSYEGALDSWDTNSITYAVDELLKEKKLGVPRKITTPQEKEGYLNEIGMMYETLLSKAPTDFKEKEFIIVKGVSDTVPAWQGVTLIDHEDHREHPRHDEDTDEQRLRADVESFAENMKTWFNKAGITNVETISMVNDLSAAELEKLKNNNAAIIFDRHTHTETVFSQDTSESALIRNRVALETPLSTFARCMMERFSIPVVSKDAINEKIKSFISESMEYLKEDEKNGEF